MELRYTCPECPSRQGSEDTGKHLYYNSDKECWFCFRCGYQGHGICPAESESVEYPGAIDIKIGKNSRPLHDILINRSSSGSITAGAAVQYLKDHRCEPIQTAWNYRLEIDGQHLVFPVYRGKRVVFFQKRNLFTKEFLNPPVETKPLMWNVTPIRTNRIAVVESFMNAVRLDRWIPACATFGKFLSDQAAAEIGSVADEVLILLDAGEGEAASKMARKLRQEGVKSVLVKTVHAPEGSDVCDLDDSTVSKLVHG